MIARIALILSAADPHASWYAESAGFYGLVCDRFQEGSEIPIDDYDVVVCCGRGGSAPSARIKNVLNRGGAVICCGDTWNLESLLGLNAGSGKQIGGGVLLPCRDASLWPEGTPWIKFFGGCAPSTKEAEVLTSLKSAEPALTRFHHGWFLGPDLGRTAELMQMGRPSSSNTPGSHTGDVDFWNQPPRSEQCSTLDLNHDRQQGAFGQPHVDALADLWMRVILTAVEAIGMSAALLWPWPGGATCAALVTAECDSPEPDDIYALDRALRYTATPSTIYCPPALFPADVLRRFKDENAEIGLLAEDMDSPEHVVERLKVQCLSLMRLSGLHNIGSLRPQDGRWQGHTEIYQAAEKAGVKVVSSKGPRQSGTKGFAFGTSRPFWVQNAGGSSVMEVPYSIFEPGAHGTEDEVEVIAKAAAIRHGCIHIALKASHLQQARQAAALRTSILAAKSHYPAFLTIDRLATFDRNRRKIRLRHVDGGFAISSDAPLANLAVLVTSKSISGTGMKVIPGSVKRLGRDFALGVISMDGVTTYKVQTGTNKSQRAA